MIIYWPVLASNWPRRRVMIPAAIVTSCPGLLAGPSQGWRSIRSTGGMVVYASVQVVSGSNRTHALFPSGDFGRSSLGTVTDNVWDHQMNSLGFPWNREFRLRTKRWGHFVPKMSPPELVGKQRWMPKCALCLEFECPSSKGNIYIYDI